MENTGKMVEVFKTNLHKQGQAKMLSSHLSKKYPLYKINFDLSDCDKILRVEGKKIKPGEIIEMLRVNGYFCEVLPF